MFITDKEFRVCPATSIIFVSLWVFDFQAPRAVLGPAKDFSLGLGFHESELGAPAKRFNDVPIFVPVNSDSSMGLLNDEAGDFKTTEYLIIFN